MPAKITVYRSAGGGGVRLDGGTVSSAPTSARTRLDARQAHLPRAHLPHGRAPRSTGVGGVQDPRGLHHIPFLESVLADPVFQRGEATTSFIDERPELLEALMGGDRGTWLLTYLADVTVNQPHGPATTFVKPRTKLPVLDTSAPLPPGNRDLPVRLGPAAFAQQLRERTDVPVTDTTFRDAHQSLLATRMRA